MNKLYESMPAFASEKEEADWLDAHAEELDGDFAKAVADGTAMNRQQFSDLMLREHGLSWPAARVSVLLSDEDIAQTKAIAAASGLAPEEFLGQIVHEALHAKRAA